MPVAEVLQSLEHGLGMIHEVRAQHHQPAALDALGEFVQHRTQLRAALRLSADASVFKQHVEVRAHRARRHVAERPVGEQQRPDRVLLVEHQVGERRRQRARVLELAHRGARRLESHRAREVEQQVAAQVGLLGVLLDQVAVAARPHLPVQVLERIAGHVRAVLGELDAEAVERRAVHAGDEALDHQARAHVEVREARDDFGIERERG